MKLFNKEVSLGIYTQKLYLLIFCSLLLIQSCKNTTKNVSSIASSEEAVVNEIVPTRRVNLPVVGRDCVANVDEREARHLVGKSFKDIITPIKTLELPISFYCGVDYNTPLDVYNDSTRYFVPRYYEILGKLPSKGKKEFLIYGIRGDINYPYLYIYDEHGKSLDSLYLHIGVCDADESGIVSNGTTINKDYSINMVDTTWCIHYIDNGDSYTKVVDSIIITKRDLYLNEDGIYCIEKPMKKYMHISGDFNL
jgi:hypothetical protein